MIYTRTITESSGGNAATPSQYRMPVTEGLIYKFELYFPPGSSGLLYVCVEDGDHRIYPSEPGEWFFGDNTLISFDDRLFITTEPHQLFIYSYNLDTAFDHKYQIRIGQVSDSIVIQSFLPALSTESFNEQIAELIAAQDQSRASLRDQAIALADEMEATEGIT